VTDARRTAETLADIGEDGLLLRIFPELPRGTRTILGPGDDAAIVSAEDGRIVVSTDVLVEGRHFRRDWSSGADVGWRAAMQNLADIAAMGAAPSSLVVALVLPSSVPVAWVLDFARGLREACEPYDVGVVGGDLSGGDAVVVAVTVQGDLGGRAPVLRSGARPGDVVALAGRAGRSAAGHAVLAADASSAGRGALRSVSADVVEAYRRPRPPLGAGVLASDAGATAMMDVSDGLLRDAGRLARASGVVIDLEPVARSFAADLEALAPVAAALGADAEEWVLTGGEDHGLLATFPAGAQLPAEFRAIGVVRVLGALGAASPPADVLIEGAPPRVASPGWDHFASH
jgi:thiamine-monophosphate kinase